MDMFGDQVFEERYPDLDEEQDIIIMDSMEQHWRDVDDHDEDRSNIYALMWDVYTKEKGELIKREFLLTIPYPKRGNIVWTCVKDSIINEKEY